MHRLTAIGQLGAVLYLPDKLIILHEILLADCWYQHAGIRLSIFDLL
jgi:hypothetical protein